MHASARLTGLAKVAVVVSDWLQTCPHGGVTILVCCCFCCCFCPFGLLLLLSFLPVRSLLDCCCCCAGSGIRPRHQLSRSVFEQGVFDAGAKAL